MMTMIKLKKKGVKKVAMQQTLLVKNNNNNDDLYGRMPGQLSSEAFPWDYHGKKKPTLPKSKP
jgi:hypothetical protein